MLQPSSACMVGHSWGGAEGRTPESAVLSSCPDGLCVQIDTGGPNLEPEGTTARGSYVTATGRAGRHRGGFGSGERGTKRRFLRVLAAQGVFWSVLAVATAGPAKPAESAPPVVTATLVQTIQTSQWNPASPDPSGIVYLPGSGRLEIADSEVDETTGAGYHGVNLWQITLRGAVQDTGTTYTPGPAFSKEPSGLGFDPATNTLFVSDDDKKKVFIDKPGSDGRFGTSDDIVTYINAGVYGSTDTEDPAFDTTSGQPTSGHLFFLDGAGTEVYEVDPVNGIFGDGNDVVTHFDVGYLGPSDFEGLGSDPAANTLLVATNTVAKKIFEITKSGTLVRTIDASGISGLKHISGVALAPASDGSGRMDYWIVDRQVDNGPNASENDGKLFEITVPGSDLPPTISITLPAEGATVSGSVTIQATASDDDGVTQVLFKDGATVIGTDTNGADGWATAWDTTPVAGGSHTITATAIDTIGQMGSDSNNVTVDNVDSPPSVTITSPGDGTAVSRTVVVQATASDDKGIAQVEFSVDGVSISTDTTSTDGWTASWVTSTATEGVHIITATATDTIGQTGSDSNNVTVDNTAPSVSMTSPTGGTVSGTIPVVADASDVGGSGVAAVEFFVDGASIGTDTNGLDGWSGSWNTVLVANGTYHLTAQATDAARNATTSAPVQVTVDNPFIIDIPVAVGADDAEQRLTGGLTLTSGDLDMMINGSSLQRAIGLRFIGVSVPQGAQVTNAYVQFRADETHSDATTLIIQGETSANAAPFTITKFNITSRPTTTNAVVWTPEPWTRKERSSPEQTPDLSSVLTEIFSSSNGWAPGNALVLIITGSGERVADSFEGAAAPVLHIQYRV
jgi:Bacterial Ig domain